MTQSFAQLQTWHEILHISQCDTWISIARLRLQNQRMRNGHWEEQRVNALISWLQQYGGLLLDLHPGSDSKNHIILLVTWNLHANWAAGSFASQNDYCRPYILYHIHSYYIPHLTCPLFQILLFLCSLCCMLVHNLRLARRKEEQQRMLRIVI